MKTKNFSSKPNSLKTVYSAFYNLLDFVSKSKNGAIEMKRSIVIAISLLVVCSYQTKSQGVTKVGTTAASFLCIDVGSRATSMGSAFVSIADDPSAIYWNPAGISKIQNLGAYFSTTKWIADLSFNFASVVLAMGDIGNMGLSATFLRMDEIEQTTVLRPDGTGIFFDAGSYAFALSYARNLTDRFSIGFNAKYIHEKLYNETASGFAMDVGALYDTHFYGLKLGMSISNYGTKMQLSGRDLSVQVDPDNTISGNNANINAAFKTDPFDLPLMFRVGMSIDMLKGAYSSNLILAADALHPNDDVESVNVGCEYVYDNLLSLRIGYKGLFALHSEQGWNYGGGIKYNIGGMTCHFDYSYIEFGLLQAVHMYTVGIDF